MRSTRLLVTTAALVGLGGLTFAQSSAPVHTGKAAYGDWHSDAPGVMRKITSADLPKPLETPSTANRSRVVAKPADAALKVPAGFAVEPFAANLPGARVLRVAPNGDIFLSLSGAG